MQRKKSDYVWFTLSIVVNIIFLLSIPNIKSEINNYHKIKVELVTVPSNQKESKVTSNEEKISKVKKEKKLLEQKKVNRVKREEELLKKLSKNMPTREVEILNSEKHIKKIVDLGFDNESLAKKEIEEFSKITADSDGKIKFLEEAEIPDLALETKENNIPDLDMNDIINAEEGEELSFKTMLDKEKVEGLPTGYKLGVEDANTIAKWDSSNKEPSYPKEAQLRGMQGKVLLKIKVDEAGRVTSVLIEKGSGVPEINLAIEQIARTWRIYLVRNGLQISGTVSLEYSFKLVGIS